METKMSNNSEHPDTPFHSGESEIQQRLGVQERIDIIGRKVIRSYLIDQHRAFFEELPFILLGAMDKDGNPWASILTGKPGFVRSPDAHSLHIAAVPKEGDPLSASLTPGSDIGILGIQTETRRRNRATGIIQSRDSGGIVVRISQSFGNCPQYIQSRYLEEVRPARGPEAQTIVSDRFDESLTAFLRNADTFFIATSYTEETGKGRGADVSHRGGRPGFIWVEDSQNFLFPDFRGNFFFNTLGNILRNPRTGISFIDYDTGDLIYMTGTAEIIWSGPDVDRFAGAQRLVRFHVSKVIKAVNAIPFKFSFESFSPTLATTGSWPASG